MKMRYALLLLTLMLAMPFLATVKADVLRAKLGCSDLEITKSVELGKSSPDYHVAQLFNTGDFNMTITCTWMPNYNSTDDITVDITPRQFQLPIDSSKAIYIKITNSKAVGNYSGEIDFTTNIDKGTYTGPISRPGASARATFNIIPISQPNVPAEPMESVATGIPWMLYILGGSGIGTIAIVGVWLFLRKRRISIPRPRLPISRTQEAEIPHFEEESMPTPKLWRLHLSVPEQCPNCGADLHGEKQCKYCGYPEP